jgi:hypothetical protein
LFPGVAPLDFLRSIAWQKIRRRDSHAQPNETWRRAHEKVKKKYETLQNARDLGTTKISRPGLGRRC